MIRDLTTIPSSPCLADSVQAAARVGVLPDAHAKDCYFAAYATVIAASPDPLETCDLGTRFGVTRVHRQEHIDPGGLPE